ncbi:hypothetical protein QYH69_07875 [Paraburkholderia sp. SARCC-3016]|uniref:hypothetical protein n=1 Tax=Paraburkholderia sp. SARCC-3016 TaxID=3058611 RepID=UPI0028072997|nr:hypothetical protein [Paraburkholderia sp. SARCC-3016]MDQ7977164.1 hypothetical protein [Paraburkholderia sp. SARCC-3016]
MEIKDVLEAIQIEGAASGDVVFISFPPETTRADFERFGKELGSNVAQLRAGGDYFPRCIIVPPGVTVDIARAQVQDRIEIVANSVSIAGGIQGSSDSARALD